MKIKPLRCPSCGAPIKIAHDRYLKCDFCRGRFIIEDGQEDIVIKQELEPRTPEELNDWNEFWEAIFNGGYYDIDEVENGDRTI